MSVTAARLILPGLHGFIDQRAFGAGLAAYWLAGRLTGGADCRGFSNLGFNRVNDFHGFLSFVGTYRARDP